MVNNTQTAELVLVLMYFTDSDIIKVYAGIGPIPIQIPESVQP